MAVKWGLLFGACGSCRLQIRICPSDPCCRSCLCGPAYPDLPARRPRIPGRPRHRDHQHDQEDQDDQIDQEDQEERDDQEDQEGQEDQDDNDAQDNQEEQEGNWNEFLLAKQEGQEGNAIESPTWSRPSKFSESSAVAILVIRR